MAYSVRPTFSWEFSISTFDAGQDRRLKPSSQLRLQQEVGERHFAEAGLGYQELYRQGMAFLLTRMNSRIFRAPELDERVTLRTWHRDTRGVQFFRCYQFLDERGELLIDSVTAFALVDVESHRLLRPGVFERFGLGEQPERRSDCPDPVKWKAPSPLEPAGERLVRWSDIDYNGHINNAVYADIACDALPGGMAGRRATGLSIAYLHEAVEGEALTLATAVQPADGECERWVVGEHPDGRRCFEAVLRTVDEAAAKG